MRITNAEMAMLSKLKIWEGVLNDLSIGARGPRMKDARPRQAIKASKESIIRESFFWDSSIQAFQLNGSGGNDVHQNA